VRSARDELVPRCPALHTIHLSLWLHVFMLRVMPESWSCRRTCAERLCSSFSDFHPEAWCPSWHVATILKATLSFMNEEASTTGKHISEQHCSWALWLPPRQHTGPLPSPALHAIAARAAVCMKLVALQPPACPDVAALPARTVARCFAGSLKASRQARKELAKQSLAHCCRAQKFRKMFPEYWERHQREQSAESASARELDTNEKARASRLCSHVDFNANGQHAAPRATMYAAGLRSVQSILPSVLVVGLAIGVLCYQYWSQRAAAR
jgi:hypothetical protein